MFEIALLTVVVVTAYLGPMILRRFGPRQRLYGLMLIADLALAVLALASIAVQGSSSGADLAGFIAIGGALFLVAAPPMVRDLGRRAMARNRLRWAQMLAELRELLQPGMGGRQEAELVGTVLAVQEGREDEVIERLRRLRDQTQDPMLRRVFNERISMTYLYARRWRDAVDCFEKVSGPNAGLSSPQLLVEMVRAYCELGQLERAAALVQRIEDSPIASEPVLTGLVSRGRLVFLAFLGRTGAVEAIVGPRGPLAAMPEAARSFWSGIARMHAGDLSGARNSLSAAARLSHDDPRAREVAEAHLASLEKPGVAGPHEVPLEVAELADRLTTLAKDLRPGSAASSGDEPELAATSLAELASAKPRRLRVTPILIALNLLVTGLVYWRFGSVADIGALIESGANLKSATLSGQWWRLFTAMFLHVSLAHLALNLYGLWVLGRLVERMHGSARALVVYCGAGLVGIAASTFWGPAATAVGASGGVMGLMGAAICELAAFRHRYPRRWSRPLLGILGFFAVAQLAIGFVYPGVEQWGHVAGLVGGAIFGLLLSPSWLRPGRVLSRVVVSACLILCAAVAVYSLVSVTTTDYADTLSGYRRVQREVGGLRVVVPESFEKVSQHDLYDPGVASRLRLHRVKAERSLDDVLAEYVETEHFGGALEAGFDRAMLAARSSMALPAGWRSTELLATASQGVAAQRHRLVVFGRVVDGEIWIGTFYHPMALTEAFEVEFGRVLESLEPAAKLAPE